MVPPGEGWTRDPFTPVIEGDRLYGRGAGDAKASVASMLHRPRRPGRRRPLRGRALGLFAYGEETRHATMPGAVSRAGRLDAALVGEPTNLQFAVAQRGLMMVDLVAHGDQRHAGYAGDGAFTNAVAVLARDLVRLDGIVAERVHPLLGVTTVTPTMLEAGVSRNVTPPTAQAVLDIRSTPRGPTTSSRWRSPNGSTATWWSPPGDWCRARHRRGRDCLPRRGARHPRPRPTDHPPAPTGVTSGISTRSRSVPGRRGGRTRPMSRSTFPRSRAARAFYARIAEEYLVMTRSETLWSPGGTPDELMLAYTVGDDREVDRRLLRWDVLGSLGHVEALRGGGVISGREHAAMRRALRAALAAVEEGSLRILPAHEDGHSAVEFWLTRHRGDVGERIHAGRSRNDQVTLDLRLFLKDATLGLHDGMLRLAGALLDFARRHRRVVWPGYTHQRIAMPSSAGVWAAGYAEQLLDAAEAIAGVWPRLDRSPLGSAAGYGVPLPLDREAAARALGFAGLDHTVTAVQNGRGQLEAAVLSWCADAAHVLARLSGDVILWSGDEFGWLVLPDALSTGSSIMPQKRNPDLFELTRARAAALDGDLMTVLQLRGGLPGGYHRDFQLLKAPLIRGTDRPARCSPCCRRPFRVSASTLHAPAPHSATRSLPPTR